MNNLVKFSADVAMDAVKEYFAPIATIYRLVKKNKENYPILDKEAIDSMGHEFEYFQIPQELILCYDSIIDMDDDGIEFINPHSQIVKWLEKEIGTDKFYFCADDESHLFILFEDPEDAFKCRMQW